MICLRWPEKNGRGNQELWESSTFFVTSESPSVGMTEQNTACCVHKSFPIGSMYAIYGNIYHQYTINTSPMLAYIPYMDPMGLGGEHYRQ